MFDEHKIILSKNFYLLISIMLFFLINPLLTASNISNLVMAVLFSMIIFFSFLAVTFNRFFLIVTWIAGILTFFTYWLFVWVDHGEWVYRAHFISAAVFLLIITCSVIISIVKSKEITADALCGAVCGYILIGFTWSFFYLSLASLDPTSFSISFIHDTMRQRVDHFIYYSFETLTTLGYGDILATKSVARTFSWLEAVIGQVYLAVWISQLVGLRVGQQMVQK